MDPTTDIKEKDLARELDVDRSVLQRLRKGLDPEEWTDWPGRGIILADSAVKKIRAALAPSAPGEVPATADIRVVATPPNRHVVLGELAAERVTVRLLRGPSSNYRPGMTLPGCTPHATIPDCWEYAGQKPRNPGRF